MLQSFRLGDFQLRWLEDGYLELDGSSLFRVAFYHDQQARACKIDGDGKVETAIICSHGPV
jgi:hypothetical protein